VANPLIDDLLASTDIVELISRYVPLKRAWSNFSGCCPFHNEKTPSFMVSPTKQIFKCFGCGKGGNALTFFQEIEKIDFRDAVKELAKNQHIDIEKYNLNTQKISDESDQKAKLKRMHSLTQHFFLAQLKESTQALDYLTTHRKLSKNLIKEYGIGYAPDKHYQLIQLLREKGFTDNDLLEASLAKKNANGEIYAFFRNRITFPIYDTMGNIVGFSARVLNPEDKPKYLNSAEHKAFEKSKLLYWLNFAKNYIREQQKLIVVEGQMDVLWLAKLETPVWVATSGTALSQDHIKLMKRYTENIFLLFDNDNAGHQATLRALKLFYQQNMFPKIIKLPEGFKDVDELSNTPEGKSAFETCLMNAQDGFLGIYHQMRSELDMTSPIDKQKLINTLFELIISVNSLTIQEHYKQLLAEKLGFAFEILDAQFKRYKTTDGKLILNQQNRQQQQENTDRYQLHRDELVVSLFYQWALEKYLWDFQGAITLFDIITIIWASKPDSLLAQALNNKLTPEQISSLNELGMWRDAQLEEHQTTEKRYQIILQAILPILQKWLQLALKHSALSAEQKRQLLELRKKL